VVAAYGSTRPLPASGITVSSARSTAVFISAALTISGVQSGCASRTSAATPAT